MEKYVILGASPQRPSDKLFERETRGARLICADGGAAAATSLGARDFIFVGDLDSCISLPQAAERVLLSREKDVTDVRAACDLALSRGAKDITLLGCSGGRLDHLLANLALLEHVSLSGARAELVDAQNRVLFHGPGAHSYPRLRGYGFFSVLALDEAVLGVTLSGVKYPLENAKLTREGSLGVSNEILSDFAQLATVQGRALAVYSADLEA